MGPRETPLEGAESAGLTDRDANLVRAIGAEELSLFTFDGLRRLTKSHPETLARSLERLEDDGVLVRSADGYVVTEKARGLFSRMGADGEAKHVPLLHTFLPYDASASRIVSALKGKWFDVVRWVGMSEAEDGYILKWVTEDGSSLIDVRISGGQLDIDARVAEDVDLPIAIRAAHQLMGRISRLYGSTRPGRRAALMRIGYYPQAM